MYVLKYICSILLLSILTTSTFAFDNIDPCTSIAGGWRGTYEVQTNPRDTSVYPVTAKIGAYEDFTRFMITDEYGNIDILEGTCIRAKLNLHDKNTIKYDGSILDNLIYLKQSDAPGRTYYLKRS